MKISCWANVKKMLLSVGIAKLVLFHGMVLTYVDQLSGVLAWNWTLNKSWSLSGVQQTLFLDQDLIQLLSVSYSGLKFECSAALSPLKYLSLIDSCELICLWHFIFQIHMASQFNSLIRVEVHFVLKTTKQVSLLLEHVCTFKGRFKSSKC